MTPRRHVTAGLDPENVAVCALCDRLLDNAIKACNEDPDNWQIGLYEGEQRKTMAPTPFEIWEPLIHRGTTSYQDNAECLLAIDNKVVT